MPPETPPASDHGQPQLPALDQGVLDVLREQAGAELTTEVIGIFRKEVPPLLEAVAVAVRERDAAALNRLAHRVKGSGMTLGLVALAHACGQVEAFARSGHADQAIARAADLPAEFARACRALDGLG